MYIYAEHGKALLVIQVSYALKGASMSVVSVH